MASEPQALSGRPWAGQRSCGSLESYRGDFDKYGRPTLKKIVCYKVIQSVSTLEWAISSAQPSKNTTVTERRGERWRGKDGETTKQWQCFHSLPPKRLSEDSCSYLDVSMYRMEVASTAVCSYIFNDNTV